MYVKPPVVMIISLLWLVVCYDYAMSLLLLVSLYYDDDDTQTTIDFETLL